MGGRDGAPKPIVARADPCPGLRHRLRASGGGPRPRHGGRPPLSAACQAWNSHIAGLIDQHRTAHELDDDQIGEIIRRFYEAQSTCSALHFEEGLAIYETIPIGPVASRPLR